MAGIIINFGINNPRTPYVFHEKLYVPFNELHVTNQKVTRFSWWDENAEEGRQVRRRRADVGTGDWGRFRAEGQPGGEGTRRGDARRRCWSSWSGAGLSPRLHTQHTCRTGRCRDPGLQEAGRSSRPRTTQMHRVPAYGRGSILHPPKHTCQWRSRGQAASQQVFVVDAAFKGSRASPQPRLEASLL